MLPAVTTEPKPARREPPIVIALILFLVAWLARALFVAAMPDETWPHSVVYKGDVFEWFTAVASSRLGTPELAGLPLRPPAMVWLVDLLWNDVTSADVGVLRHVWRVLGALVAPLTYLAIRRDFSEGLARGAGVLAAFITGPLLLSTVIESETPYLVLVMASFALPARGLAGGFGRGLLHGAACLFRVEHIVVVALLALWGLTRPEGRRVPVAAGAFVGFVVVLAPWHLHAWERTAAVMATDAPRHAAAEEALTRIEQRSARVTWSHEAAAERDAWPAFVRRTAAAFVADTVRHRGRTRVEPGDVAILDEAFDTRPVALPARFFVSLYGPLNLALSTDERAFFVGFQRQLLDDPPLLAGGPSRYPAELVTGIPPASLSLDYLPHLALLAGADVTPADALAVVASKRGLLRAVHAWRGAASGFGGFALPLGISGTRGSVDLVVTRGTRADVWCVVLFLLVVVGAWRGGARTAPWVLFLGAQLVIAAIAFGYARFGATAAPAVAVLLALALQKWSTERNALILAVALLTLELVRATVGIDVTIDGQAVGVEDPIPLRDYSPHEVHIEFSSPH